MPSVFLKTYGCQMNERDSEAVAAQLVARGYTLAASESGADVVLLNTCSVRDLAEQKALGKMTAIVGQTRRSQPGQIRGFLGCMAQSRGESLVRDLPGVQLVVGTQKFHRTGDHLDALLSGRERQVVDIGEENGSQSTIREHLLTVPGASAVAASGAAAAAGPRQVSALVSIMQGCNQHCTFCIVPQTRGAERCRPIPEIVEECRDLVARGVREITLLGQIVNRYGRREYPVVDGKSGFVQLLEAVHALEGLERIRFTSPHPKGYGGDLIEAYGRLPKLVESAHLPVQSGSDRILKAMHRGYTREHYLGIVGRLRAVRPGMGLSTDIIVGFPGETEEDFEQTVLLCEEVGFDMAYLFKYSPRKDTPAASMPGQVPGDVIEARHRRLLERTNEISRRRYERWVGRMATILVEGPSRRNPARHEGRTPCNKIVVFPGAPRHVGQLLDVRVERVGTYTLYGDPAIVNLDPADAGAEHPTPPAAGEVPAGMPLIP